MEIEIFQNWLSLSAEDRNECAQLMERFGLSLSQSQIQTLEERRCQALKDTGRVEFGGGVLKKLIYAFCDSPYVSQDNCEETLLELQDLFYYFKNESMEKLSDDELIEAMYHSFHEEANGSLEYLAGTSLEALCRGLRCGKQTDWREGDV